MNRFLADAVGFLNALFAVLIIGFWAVIGGRVGGNIGYGYMQQYGYTGSRDELMFMGMVVGGGVGLLFAIAFCGLLALFFLMYKELKAIRQQVAGTSPASAAFNRSASVGPTIVPPNLPKVS
jgi:hypothetical protein